MYQESIYEAKTIFKNQKGKKNLLILSFWRFMTSAVHWITTKYLSSWNELKRQAEMGKVLRGWAVGEMAEVCVWPLWRAAHMQWSPAFVSRYIYTISLLSYFLIFLSFFQTYNFIKDCLNLPHAPTYFLLFLLNKWKNTFNFCESTNFFQ